MNASQSASIYKNQQIMTASPEELTLMLYNGAIRFVNESIRAVEQGHLPQAHTACMRAQEIVREFMATLDMQYDISHNYMALYDYIQFRLIQANAKKDKAQFEEARGLLTELRDAWAEAMKISRLAKVVGK